MNQETLFDVGLPVYSKFIGQPVELHSVADRSRAAQLALLSVLLKDRGRKASADDIVRDASKPYRDGGKWLGPAIRELAEDGLVRPVGTSRSKRAARHSGLLTVWEIADCKLAKRKVARLRRVLSFHKNTDSTVAPVEPADSSDKASKGGPNNGQTI